jgi:hypothetical protein
MRLLSPTACTGIVTQLPIVEEELPPKNSWQYAALMTRKAEEEARFAEQKSQEAYQW